MADQPERLLERIVDRSAKVAPSDLAQALEDYPREGDVVGETLLALDKEQRAVAVKVVADRLDADDTAVRRGAAFALHHCFDGDPMAGTDVETDLASAFGDDDYVVRRHASRALVDVVVERPAAAVAAVDSIPLLLDATNIGLLSAGLDLAATVAETDPDAAVALLEPLLNALDEITGLETDVAIKMGLHSEVTEGAMDHQERYRREVQRQRNHLADVVSWILLAHPKTVETVLGPILVVLNRDSVGDVRATLVETLGHIAESEPEPVARSIETLAGLLGEGDHWVVATAAWTLGVLGDTHGARVSDAVAGHIDSLISLLESNIPDAHIASAGLLAYVGEHRPNAAVAATNALLARLDDENPEVRASAALALGHVGAENAVPDLQKRAESDPDETVRATTNDAIERIMNGF